VECDGNEDDLAISASDGGYVCYSVATHADAELIAAAPDLLAALKRVVDLANCAMDYSGVDAEHTLKRAMERISKAKCVCETSIAKAERSA
jgi:hypothetical protein